MFEAEVPYIGNNFLGAHFFWRQVGEWSAMGLFVTGTLHTPKQAATELELLEVGYLQRRRILPFQPEGLSFFRRAQETRDAHGIEWRIEPEQLFSSMEDIKTLELDIDEGRIINFMKKCYAPSERVGADRTVFNNRAHIRKGTFVFFRLTPYDTTIL